MEALTVKAVGLVVLGVEFPPEIVTSFFLLKLVIRIFLKIKHLISGGFSTRNTYRIGHGVKTGSMLQF